jgi:polyisoprenoid-binding protein YceI
MKYYIRLGIFAAVLVAFAMNSHAAPSTWAIDPAHSGFYFSINHIYSKTNGFFEKYDGTIQFDPQNLDASRFAFTVKVKSVNTNNGKRDGHLQSNEFFDAKRFPDMTFESKSISHIRDNDYRVRGMLTIKDVTKEVDIPFTYFGFKQHPFNPKQDVAGFEARLAIDRLEYNVGNGKFYDMGVVGKTVDVFITIEATRKK